MQAGGTIEHGQYLRALILEDNRDDAELMVYFLRRAGYQVDWKWVQDERSYRRELNPDIDIILADFSLPGYDALRALELLKERDLDVPFIVVSGTISEETAVSCLRSGAIDYLLKDRLTRLGSAVSNALEERQLRREQRRAKEEILRRNRELAMLNQVIAAATSSLEPRQVLITACQELAQAFGAKASAVLVFDLSLANESAVTESPVVSIANRNLYNAACGPMDERLEAKEVRKILQNYLPEAIEMALQLSQPIVAALLPSPIPGTTAHILLIPLVVRGQAQGILLIGAFDPTLNTTPLRSGPPEIRTVPAPYGRFTAEDTTLAINAAAAVAQALDNARLYDETRRRVEELSVIQEISTAVRVYHQMNDLLPALLEKTAHSAGALESWLFLTNPDAGLLELRACWPHQAELIGKVTSLTEGLSGRIIRRNETFIQKGTPEDLSRLEAEIFRPVYSLNSNNTHVALPLQARNQAVGVLHLRLDDRQAVTQDLLRLLNAIASITASAIQRARFQEQLEQSLRRMQILHEMDRAMNTTNDLPGTLNLLMKQVMPQLDVDIMAVHLYHPDSQNLECLAIQGSDKCKPGSTWRATGSLAGEALRTQQPQNWQRVDTNSPTDQNRMDTRLLSYKPESIHAYTAYPLVSKGQSIGVLEIVQHSPRKKDGEWTQFLETIATQVVIALDKNALLKTIQENAQALSENYDETLLVWGQTLEMNGALAAGHTRRSAELVARMARHLNWSPEETSHLYRGALLHDIGLLGIPQEIVAKPGALSDAEREIVRRHTQIAHDLLKSIALLQLALDVPYCHHERWDGSGYPRGLRGEQIPLAARLFSVVDVWDSLIHDRPYSRAWTLEQAREHLRQEAGKQFDPQVVALFFELGLDKLNEPER